jgi:hypothetical protein
MGDMLTRKFSAPKGPSTYNKETHTVEAVATTETPVEIYDWEHGRVLEVLLMNGAQLPPGKQIPLLDSHNRYNGSDSVKGSYRGMKVSGEEMLGTVHFSDDEETQKIEKKFADGHLTDFSIGYQVSKDDTVFVPRGETANVKGKDYIGPMVIRKKWWPKELSITPIGKDPNAKGRADENITKKEEPKGDNTMGDIHKTEKDKKTEDAGVQEEVRQENTVVSLDKGAIVQAERSRVTEINGLARELDMDFTQYIDDGTPVETVREIALKAVIERNKVETAEVQHSPAIVQADERDKFRDAMTDGFEIRLGRTPEKPVQGAFDLAGYTLREVCRHIVKINNLDRSGNPSQIVTRAMSTSDFSNIMANVMNKSLFSGFETQPETYQMWVDETGSTNDFKPGTIAKISGTSGLTEIPEGAMYEYGKRTDDKETFQVLTYGEMLSFTRQAIINDDLGALNDNMKQLGEDVRIKIGDLCYAVLTANAAMNDGVALFDATHANIATGTDLLPPGVASIAEGIRAMKVQTDLQGLKRLNIRPPYFIAPVALEGSSEVFFRSGDFSDHSTVATDSSFASTRNNIYSGNYFTRVYDARLDANSTKYWYLAGPKGKTVKLWFLNGQRTPYMDTKQGWTVDGIEMKIRIDVTAAPVDYRALYLNPDT